MGHITENSIGHFVFLLIWTFFPLPSISGRELPELLLQDRVCVALKWENISINYELKMLPNLTQGQLTCFDPSHKLIYTREIPGNADYSLPFSGSFILKNVNLSGEYYCQYQTAKAYWFLRLRDSGYKEVVIRDYTEVVIVSVFTGLLLVFSVVGSVYVFRAHWECCKAEQKSQNRAERQENNEDTNDPSQSASYYASLDPRTKSIYDVLDHSATSRQREQTKVNTPKRKDTQKTVEPPQNQDEGIFECVYENF